MARARNGNDEIEHPMQMPSEGSFACCAGTPGRSPLTDRKSTRLNSSHLVISYAVFCLKKNTRSVPQALRERTRSAAARGTHLTAPAVGSRAPRTRAPPCVSVVFWMIFFFFFLTRPPPPPPPLLPPPASLSA